MARQSDLRFTFTTAHASTFDVVAFTLEEALSEPFRLDVQLASSNPAVDSDAFLDTAATFTVWLGVDPVRHVHGLISAFTQGDTGFRRTRYRAIIEPAMVRMGLTSNWRTFQQQSVAEIIATVLRGEGLPDAKAAFASPHLSREFCVQAGETNLDFLARLAAEEGVLYAFEHRMDGHTLIHTDAVQALGELDGAPVVYQPSAGGDQPIPCLRRFEYTTQVRTTRQVQRDHWYRHPRYDQQHTAGTNDGPHVRRDYETYTYPGRYKDDAAGKPFTATRLAALRADARMARAEGDDARIVPGVAFTLAGHPRADFNGAWRAVRLRHHGTQHVTLEEDAAGGDIGTTYNVEAELIPATVNWKAPMPPKPRIDGPQIATVVGLPNEEIDCNEWGSIKVQFPWDREGGFDEKSSCWIRVSQGWAGPMYGQMAIPRIGHSVIVDFLDGDPDQPIVTGRTYNASNLPPYALGEHKTRTTIKTQTHKGEGFNELRFEDEKGREEIYIHAQKDQTIEVLNDERITIGHDRVEQVANDDTVAVGRDGHVTIGQDLATSVERNHRLTTGKDRFDTVNNNRIDRTVANYESHIGGDAKQYVGRHHALEAGESITTLAKRHEASGECFVWTTEGGTLSLDAEGLKFNGQSVSFSAGKIVMKPGEGGAARAIARDAKQGLSRAAAKIFLS